jgi:hypothetical protein
MTLAARDDHGVIYNPCVASTTYDFPSLHSTLTAITITRRPSDNVGPRTSGVESIELLIKYEDTNELFVECDHAIRVAPRGMRPFFLGVVEPLAGTGMQP